MKDGHVTGTKRERTGASDWYKQLEEANIRRIEAEWQVRRESVMKECRNTSGIQVL